MLKDKGEFIKFLYGKYAVPSVMALLAAAISTFLNTSMAGAFYGNEGLGSVGFFMPVFFIFSTLGSLIGVGAANACSKAIAKDDFRFVSSAFTLATSYNAVVGIVTVFLAFCFSDEIILFLTGMEVQSPSLKAYFLYSVIGGVLSMYIYVPLNFTKIDGKPKVSLYMFLAMFGVNLLANLVFVFGCSMGVEALAAGGAAGSLGAVALGLFFLFFKKGSVSFIRPYGVKEITAGILLLGAPMALNNFYNFLRVMMINFILVYIGAPSAVGVFAVLTTITTFVMAVASGLGQAIVMPAAVFSNKYDMESIRLIAREAFRAGNLFFAVIALGILLFSKGVCQIFALDGPEIYSTAHTALICFSLSLMPAVNNVLFSFYYTALYRLRLANIINICRGLLFVVAVSWLLAPSMGERGVWLALLVAEVLTLASTAALAVTEQKKARREGRFLSVPLLLDISPEREKRYLAFSVDDNEFNITDASQMVYKFCEERGLDAEQTMFISMSVEETLMFIKTKRERSSKAGGNLKNISVRIYMEDEEKNITFMYSGKSFNPIQYFLDEIAGDFEKSLDVIGIQYIIQRAKDITFTETFGVNNLSILL